MNSTRHPSLSRLFCCVVGLCVLAPRPSSGADAGAALAAWQTELKKVSSISSGFVQEKHMALFQDTLVIRGRVLIDASGNFAWETHWPVRYKMVVADGRIRQWDEETDRVQTISMRDNPAASAIFEQMSAWFSGEYASLTNNYEVTLAAAQPVSFLFVPHAGSPATNYLTSVQVWLRADGAYLDKVRITERTGDSTDIVYTNTILNQPMPAEAWNVKLLTSNAVPVATAPAPVGGPGKQ